MSFDEENARVAIASLKKKGIQVAVGLSYEELERVEHALGAKVPEDLSLLLREGVPLSWQGGARFPDWHSDPAEIVRAARAELEQAFSFDIENDNYWHESFGPKPLNSADAKNQALEVLRTLPPLIPIYGHRYMPSYPAEKGNPILSIYQASDTVYYGYDLADYLFKEFDVRLP